MKAELLQSQLTILINCKEKGFEKIKLSLALILKKNYNPSDLNWTKIQEQKLIHTYKQTHTQNFYQLSKNCNIKR